MRSQSHDTYTWTIREIILEAPATYSLVLEPAHERPTFISGQYLTVRISGFEPSEGKSYSISSDENNPRVQLTIKEMGTFSKAILSHKIGDTLTTSAPYGFFYPDRDEKRNLAFIAGGIGITPCMSIIKTLLNEEYPNTISLFYSNRTHEDIIFNKELMALEHSFPQFTMSNHLTREIAELPNFKNGRMTSESILSSLTEPHTTDFFICGSIAFTKGLWGELKNAGIPSTQIYTEGYF